jgi:hypothetical protein
MTKTELLEALLVERQDQRWWRHRPTAARPATWDDGQFVDDDLTCARRRKALEEAWRDEPKENAS